MFKKFFVYLMKKYDEKLIPILKEYCSKVQITYHSIWQLQNKTCYIILFDSKFDYTPKHMSTSYYSLRWSTDLISAPFNKRNKLSAPLYIAHCQFYEQALLTP